MNKVKGNKNTNIKKYPSRCYICSKDILVFRSSLENKRNFCSYECEARWKSDYWKELQKTKSFGFQKGHRMNIDNQYAKGNHPRSEWKIGHISWNKNKSWSQEIKDKLSRAKTGIKLSIETRKKMSLSRNSPEMKKKMSESTKLYMSNEKNREELSERVKSALNNPEIRAKMSKTWIKKGEHLSPKTEFSLNRIKEMVKMGKFCIRPNKPEKLLKQLLDELFPKEYKYVGNFKFWIERYNPDFININGQKKIIELFGRYYHSEPKRVKKDEKRLTVYKRYGYKTLVIWDDELENINDTKNKLILFQKG